MALDASAYSLTVKKSKIAHPESGSGLFAARNFGKREVIEYYYGSLVYADQTRTKQWTKKYCGRAIEVTIEGFRKWANQLLEKVNDRDGNEHTIWTVPSLFCAIKCINDARYFPGGNTPDAERWRNPKEKNVQFL